MEASTASQDPVATEYRQHVTILFTDLSDSTQLSGAMEAETYATMLDDVRQAFRTAVEVRGGTVNQYQGDGLQAIFGHLDLSEHDGARASEAALEVHDRVRALRERHGQEGASALSVHSGVHTGQALIRPGNDVSGRLEIFGAAPGIAKHLSDIAEADEILVSDETLGPAGYSFATDEPRRLMIKGRSDPLAVRRILSSRGRRGQFEEQTRRGIVSFAGRDRELAQLDDLLAKTVGGGTGFVVLTGAAGVGKTRLAAEFLRRAGRRGCEVLRGYCEADLSAEPLQPFLQMLRTQLQIAPDASSTTVAHAIETRLVPLDRTLAASSAQLMQVLSVSPQAGGPSQRNAEQAMQAMRAVIAALARRGPLVLFVDDWQWADDAARQFLYAVHDEGSAQLLLLLAARSPSEVGLTPVGAGNIVEVSPLAEPEALATVAELLPDTDPFLAAQIVSQSGGNPLYLEELCHFAASAGAQAALQPSHGGPAWLESLIEARIARLPRGQRLVLDAAAVLGNLVPTWLLERLTGCTADHPDVGLLAAQDLLFPAEEAGMLRFKHGITRDVAYGAISLQVRRDAHRRAAALLAAASEPSAEAQACEALAYHFNGAAEHARASHYAAMAGDKAMAASSIDRAKAHYRAALVSMDRMPASAEAYQVWRSIVRRLSLASVFDPARDDLQLFERAVVLARAHGDVAGEASASYWLAFNSYALGETRRAFEHGATALAAAQAAGDAKLQVQVRVVQGQALAASGNFAAAEQMLDEALAVLASATGPATPNRRAHPGVAYALACRAGVSGDRGLLDQALAGFDLALAAVPAPGHEVEGSVLCLRSNVQLCHGRWHEAAQDALAAQHIAERVRSLYLLAMARALGAWADWQLGGGARALHTLAEATAWLIARDKRLFISLNHGRLAEGLVASGQPAQARRQATAALLRWRGGDPFGAAMALRALARAASAEGRRPLALRRMALADRIAAARDSGHERAANALCREELGLLT